MIGIELLASATEFLCGMLVLAAFFSWQEGRKCFRLSVVFLCGLVHICLSMFTNSWSLAPRMALILANWFLVCEVCYCGNAWKRILIILLFWAAAFAIDMSVLTMCMAVMNWSAKVAVSPSASYLISMLSARSLLLSISFGCGYIVRHQERKQERSSGIWVCLLLIPLYTIVGIGALISNALEGGTLSSGMIALSGGLLCINVLLCLVVNRLEQNRQAEEEKRNLQAEATHNLELAKTYQDSFHQQRKATHEFRNQLDVVENLLAQGEYQRAFDYVRHLQCTVQETVPLIHANHPMVDAVVNQKYRQAVERGIGMLFYLNDLSGIPMEDADLVTLLGNVLDNAISASQQTQEKQIWVRLWLEQGVCQMVVRNSCPDTPADQETRERILHGFGMDLVGAVLEKYGYPYYAERLGPTFIFSAMLG